MHSTQVKWRTRTTVLAVSALAMSGAATICGASSASADPGAVLANGQCSVELFANQNLTGDLAVASTNPFSIRGASEPNNPTLYFDDVHADLNSTVVTAPGTVSPVAIKTRANSVRVTCTFNSVDGNGTAIHAVPTVNGESVPDTAANGCSKAEGATFVNPGASVVKMYVRNQLSGDVAGKVSDIAIAFRPIVSRVSCP